MPPGKPCICVVESGYLLLALPPLLAVGECFRVIPASELPWPLLSTARVATCAVSAPATGVSPLWVAHHGGGEYLLFGWRCLLISLLAALYG
jgi:hypothetical protein